MEKVSSQTSGRIAALFLATVFLANLPWQSFAQSAPEPLMITGVTANTVGLAWNDIYTNEDGFRLTRSDSWGNWSVLEFPANTTSYLDTNLTTGLTYYYSVVAFNSGGESAPAFNSAVPTPIPAPEPLMITGVTANTVGLAWNDIYTNEDGFRLERAIDAENFAVIAYLSSNEISYVNTTLTANTHYYYRVAAFNLGGDSAYAFADVITPPSPPAAPSGVTATAISQTQIALGWTDNAGNETGFRIERSLDGMNFALLTTVAMDVTSFTDTGLSPITTYYYRVIAFNAGGTSAASNIGSATTPDYPPASPSALVATAVSATQINLAWTDNASNETGYQIEGSTDGVNFTQVATVAANVTSYSNTGLSASTTYCFRVRASNSGGYSGYSNVASATTAAAAPPTAPSNLMLTVVSSSQINLQWNDNSSNETQFLIERALNNSSFTQIATVAANVRNYSATGLQPNTRYFFRVCATNTAGNSAYSNTAQAKTSH
jgi:titin